MDVPGVPEELLDELLASLIEMRMADNGDGTTTMTFVVGREETAEFSVVFQVSLAGWVGQALRSMIEHGAMTEEMHQYLGEGIEIPNTPDDVV